jgi:hypothetical protein
MLSDTQIRSLESLRSPRKLFDGRGLYLLVASNGGRYWRYNYRIDGKFKALALGIYPDVPLAKARARHQLARQLLADGIDPSVVKRAAGKRFEAAALECLTPAFAAKSKSRACTKTLSPFAQLDQADLQRASRFSLVSYRVEHPSVTTHSGATAFDRAAGKP